MSNKTSYRKQQNVSTMKPV